MPIRKTHILSNRRVLFFSNPEGLRDRGTRRVSTSTKLPGTNRVTRTLLSLLLDNRPSVEEALTKVVDSMGEQTEQVSLIMSELERAVRVERESLREGINRTKQKLVKAKGTCRRRQMITCPEHCLK